MTGDPTKPPINRGSSIQPPNGRKPSSSAVRPNPISTSSHSNPVSSLSPEARRTVAPQFGHTGVLRVSGCPQCWQRMRLRPPGELHSQCELAEQIPLLIELVNADTYGSEDSDRAARVQPIGKT